MKKLRAHKTAILLCAIAVVLLALFLPRSAASVLHIPGQREGMEYQLIIGACDVVISGTEAEPVTQALDRAYLQYRGPYQWISLEEGEHVRHLCLFRRMPPAFDDLGSCGLDQKGYLYLNGMKYKILWGGEALDAALQPYLSALQP